MCTVNVSPCNSENVSTLQGKNPVCTEESKIINWAGNSYLTCDCEQYSSYIIESVDSISRDEPDMPYM